MRNIFFVNPKFQLRFMAYMGGVSVAVLSVFYVANLYFFRKFMDEGKSLGLPPDNVFFEFLESQQKAMNSIFSITALIAFGVVFFAGLYLSHRVAGPLHRLRNHMLDTAAGKTDGPVKFRDGDQFQELAEAYNQQLQARKDKTQVA